jgi:cell division protein FtsB
MRMPEDRPARAERRPGSAKQDGRPGSARGAGGPGSRRTESPARPAPPSRARLTSRAAVLAVVLCAVALSLAYPVREYIAERRQIDQLQAQREAIATRLAGLQAQQRELTSNAYVQQQAEDRLHMCLPTLTCYVIINPAPPRSALPASTAAAGPPWYERLWQSVREADKEPAR